MPSHTATSLFDKNIQSACECVGLYDGVSQLQPNLQIDWILRAAVVFAVSALDTYFHDKVRYRVGRFSTGSLPPALAKFTVPLEVLAQWEKAQRKGNVIRNWVMDHLSVRPLQSPENIADALKLAGITALWDTIQPDVNRKRQMLEHYSRLVKRRNQISHEGDRETSRRSGKRLRSVDRTEVVGWIDFVKSLVAKIQTAFPS